MRKIYMNTGRILLISALLVAAFALGDAEAQSIFSREGLGEWYEGYDLRGESLGGTGIGTIVSQICTNDLRRTLHTNPIFKIKSPPVNRTGEVSKIKQGTDVQSNRFFCLQPSITNRVNSLKCCCRRDVLKCCTTSGQTGKSRSAER